MIYETDRWYLRDKANNRISHDKWGNPKARRTSVSAAAMQRRIAEWELRASLAKPRYGQLQHLMKRIGGVLPLALAVGVHPDKILWNWLGVSKTHKQAPKQRSGLLMYGYMIRLLKYARHFGLVLTPEDIFPDLIANGVVKNPCSHPEIERWMHEAEPNINMKELEDALANLTEIE